MDSPTPVIAARGAMRLDASAARIARVGDPDVIAFERRPLALPSAGQVVVRHEAVGVNFVDIYYRSGLYETPLPSSLGSEAAGIVEAVGEGVVDFAPGDRVGSFTGPLGAYADRRVIGQEHLVRLPDGLPAIDAAAAMLKGCTAEALIERCARVQPGDTVLVHAAAGGVGSLLVQWLKAIGATVIAHAGDQRKAEFAAALGADHALCCPLSELAATVRRLTDGEGVRVVFDGVGAASWQASLDAAATRGMLVSYGNASGPVPPVRMLDLRAAGSLFVTRPALADYCSIVAQRRASAARLFDLMMSGAVSVHVGQQFSLSRASDAHRAIEGRRTRGSTVLLPE